MLEAHNISLSFGGLAAVKDVSIKVEDKKITGLIGPNGAGKTTFFNLISGIYAPNKGKILLDSKDITNLKPYQIIHEGVARTYQVINLFNEMTVIENVMVGMHTRMKSGYFSAIFKTKKQQEEEKNTYAQAGEFLEFTGLADKKNFKAGSLSYGEQRKLEIARALASDPRILLLDEPAAGMNTSEKAELLELLSRILERGVAIFIIEHDMKLMMNISNYIYVLSYGQLIAEGTPEHVQYNPDVISAYLGVSDNGAAS